MRKVGGCAGNSWRAGNARGGGYATSGGGSCARDAPLGTHGTVFLGSGGLFLRGGGGGSRVGDEGEGDLTKSVPRATRGAAKIVDGEGDAHRGRGASSGAFAVRECALEHRLLLHELFLEFQEVSLLRGGPRGAAARTHPRRESSRSKGKRLSERREPPLGAAGGNANGSGSRPSRRVPTVVDPPRTPDATIRRVPRSFATLGAAETARAGRRPSPARVRGLGEMSFRCSRSTLWAFTLASKRALSRKLRPCVTEFRQRGGALHRVVFNGSRTLTNDLTPACARPRPQHSRVRKNEYRRRHAARCLL